MDVYTGWVSKHPDATLGTNILYGVLTFITAIVVGYITLKFYDEPVRRWLKKKFSRLEDILLLMVNECLNIKKEAAHQY